MYKLYFRPAKGRDKLVGKAKTYDEGWKMMVSYLHDLGYKPQYYRIHTVDYKGETAHDIDFGSHTEFCFLVIHHDKKS